MGISTKQRSKAPEIMDDFSMEGPVLRDALDKIAAINRFLGGNKLTLDGVSELLDHCMADDLVTIVDFGCGNGDMLRAIADSYKTYRLRLIGIDANAFAIEHAKQLSADYQIEYLCDDFLKHFYDLHYDIGLCTLTLHHFNDEEILSILSKMYDHAKCGIVINDLHRTRSAYYLFEVVCKIFGLNRMSRHDGLTSILRGFKKDELVAYSDKLNFKKYKIRWKWAFRYQWIIQKV